MTACPFRFTADFSKRAFTEFLYSNDLITYTVFLLKFNFIAYTGGVFGFEYIHISLRRNTTIFQRLKINFKAFTDYRLLLSVENLLQTKSFQRYFCGLVFDMDMDKPISISH